MINRNFIDQVLEQMNFLVKWRNWISCILSSARSTVLVNGSPTFDFKHERGVRQGDPLSPFLFIIGMEVLSKMFLEAENQNRFIGFKAPNNGPSISHLLYADDAIIIGELSVKTQNVCFVAFISSQV